MAPRTNTESIRELERNASRFDERLEQVSRDITRIDRLHEKMADQITGLNSRFSILETRILDLLRRQDETDRWRIGLQMAFFGSLMTLMMNLLLLALRR